jgi:hypothetical protein
VIVCLDDICRIDDHLCLKFNGTTTLQINVNRLKYPTFSGTGTYSANLREDDPVGKDVVQVQAFRTPTLVGVFDKSLNRNRNCNGS